MSKKKTVTSLMYELEFQVKTKIRFGATEDKIIKSLLPEYAAALGEDDVTEFIKEKVAEFGDYDFIQKIMRSKIVRDASGKDLFVLDPLTRSIQRVTDERLRNVLHPKLDISEKFYTCKFVYNPYKMAQLFKDKNGMWCYNMYTPPPWQMDCFYSSGAIPIEKIEKLPKLYERFLNHLTDNDEESVQYIIEWMANSIQHRNYCILTTIGEQGIGKGRLFDIMKVIFGDNNFSETGKKLINERFNGQLKNKRIIYLDETSIKSQEQEERLKVLVNNSLEVEAKGKDAEQISNFASIYLSSNNMDAIRLEHKDRRFSIINLTETSLKSVWSHEEIDSLTDPENVEKFAKYLYHYPVDRKKMLDVFISKRTEEVREEGLSGWQSWLVDEYAIENAGRTVKVEVVAEAIENIYGSKFRPSKTGFKKVEKIYPTKMQVCKPKIDGKQVWCIKFPDLTSQTDNK